METLEKYELKGEPPKVFIDTKDEIDLLNLKFCSLENEFKKLKLKLLKNNKDKIKVDSLTKLRLLLNSFEIIINNIEEIIVSLDLEGKWTLTENDIDRINYDRETNHLFKTILPYILTYKIMKDVDEVNNKNT